jgi:hypothetical protein
VGGMKTRLFFLKGGNYLGVCRSAIQRKFKNGETVTWGSFDELKPAARVCDIEEIATDVFKSTFSNFPESLNDILNSLPENHQTHLEFLNELKGEIEKKEQRIKNSWDYNIE